MNIPYWFEESGLDFSNPLIDIFPYAHHLSVWYSIDIVRRNSVLVTHGSWSLRINNRDENPTCWAFSIFSDPKSTVAMSTAASLLVSLKVLFAGKLVQSSSGNFDWLAENNKEICFTLKWVGLCALSLRWRKMHWSPVPWSHITSTLFSNQIHLSR